MFESKDLVKTFRSRKTSEILTPVNRVSIQINAGEHVGLLGPSGCGKTTFSRVMMKLIKPDGGRISLDGEDVTDISNKNYRKYRNRVQMVFQNPYASMNPMKNIKWSLDETYATFWDEPPDYRALCERFEIPYDILERRPVMVSGGELQRISIMRCLACNPEYMILDEPTSMLDVSIQASIMRYIMDMTANEKTGVLLITHDIDLAKIFCDRVYLMDDGRILESGPADRIFEDPKTERGRDFLKSSYRG